MERNNDQKRLLEKSIEAFVCAIEVYNKPTLKYRVEGFSFFICNAWELMIKSYMIQTFGEDSIYLKNDPHKAKGLSACLDKAFPNEKDPQRQNLESILWLRNQSTHFVTPEYESVFAPLFQACILNFVEKIKKWHGVTMQQIISQNFLQLPITMTPFDESAIRTAYPSPIAEKLIATQKAINEKEEVTNNGYAVNINYILYLTNKAKEADAVVRVDNNASQGVKVVKQIQNPNETHKYNVKKGVKEIQRQLEGKDLHVKFNKHTFQLFVDAYDMKNKPQFCFTNNVNESPQYSYSMTALNMMVQEIEHNPEHFEEGLKAMLGEKRKRLLRGNPHQPLQSHPRVQRNSWLAPTPIQEPSCSPSQDDS